MTDLDDLHEGVDDFLLMRDAIKVALSDVAEFGSGLARRAFAEPPPSGSLAEKLENDPANFEMDEGWSCVRLAHLAILATSLSAVDHVQAFVGGIQKGRLHSASLATIARGAVEALARSYWLLELEGAAPLVQRFLSLSYDDTAYLKKSSTSLRFKSGPERDVEQYRAYIKGELTARGLELEIRGSKARVARLIDFWDRRKRGVGIYSNLSSVAHGEIHALNFLLSDSTSDWSLGLTVPRELVVNMVFVMNNSLISVLDRMIRFFEPESEVKGLWRKVRKDSLLAMSMLMPD